jgi:hypothetical protein
MKLTTRAVLILLFILSHIGTAREKWDDETGNGLCTIENKGKNQMKFCPIILRYLEDENSCAGKAMREIIHAGGRDGNNIKGMNQYCSTYGGFGTNKILIFQNYLSQLMSEESSGIPKSASGISKGLFRISVSDGKSPRYPDCKGLTDKTILEAEPNIKCGTCVALTNLRLDMAMGEGSSFPERVHKALGRQVPVPPPIGVARYFGSVQDQSYRRRDRMAATLDEYCKATAKPVVQGANGGKMVGGETHGP